MTGPLRVGPCLNGLPDWLPVAPGAQQVACIAAATDKGVHRFASFRVEPAALPAVLDFYESALRDVAGLGGGSRHSEGMPGHDWKGRLSRSGDPGGREVFVLADSEPQRTPLAVVVIGYRDPAQGDRW